MVPFDHDEVLSTGATSDHDKRFEQSQFPKALPQNSQSARFAHLEIHVCLTILGKPHKSIQIPRFLITFPV